MLGLRLPKYSRTLSSSSRRSSRFSPNSTEDLLVLQTARRLKEHPHLIKFLVKQLPQHTRVELAEAILDETETVLPLVAHGKHKRKILDASSEQVMRRAVDSSSSGNAESLKSAYGKLFAANAVPFVGFGFMDNAVMIVAGDLIDHHVGISLGISTMAAAALGNTFSDVVGIGAGGVIESFALKLGLPQPELSRAQMAKFEARMVVAAGSTFGIVLGCGLGMFPLLFL